MSVFHLARWHLMSEVSQDWQMYILVVVLSCSVTLKEHTHTHTHMHGHYPLDFIFQFFFPGGGVGRSNVFLSHSSSERKHTQASSSSLLIETVASR